MRTSRLTGSWLAGAAAAALLAGAGLPGAALAQQAPPPSENLAINLVRLLVRQGVITQSAADDLIRQAEAQTDKARAYAPEVVATNGANAPAAGVVRVPYIPQIVRDQIRDEVKAEVLAEAKSENWAAPNAIPDWVDRVELTGDVRFRDQYNLYDRSNTNELVDFAALNALGPTDVNDRTNPGGLPFLNTRNDRSNLLSIRARLGVNVRVDDRIFVGVRLASGDNNGPVSTTQLLGGGFSKKDFWLDRAFITVKPTPWAAATFGRMANPFFSTDLLYDEDLNFDGAVATAKRTVLPRQNISLAVTGGAFPVDYQAQNFPSNAVDKGDDKNKFLFGGQVVAEWAADYFNWRAGIAYYVNDVRGELSSPCPVYANSGVRACDTDFSRPAFLQKGNTLFFTRNLVSDPTKAAGDTPVTQLLGLAFDYDELNLTTELDYRIGYSKHLVLTGDYVRNMAYNGADICRYGVRGLPINNVLPSAAGNVDPCSTPAAGDSRARFQSGPNAWYVRALFGDPKPVRFGEWNIAAGYKHIEPDAVLDGFNDSDFHLGGTNAEGYFISAAFGLFYGASIQGRWFSANEISGPPLSIDVGQIDLNVRF